ncbi:MAG: hypothetical protein JJE47_05780 [Acidimicrobiia bacterium]|nr:hypothetical protein [Acidimicrobiia bacterium]
MPAWTRLIGGWILALIVALALSWGAVSMVRGGVIETSGAVRRTVPNASETTSIGSSLPSTSSSSVSVDIPGTIDSAPDPSSTTRDTAPTSAPPTPLTTRASTGTSSTTAISSPTSSSSTSTSTSSTTSTTVSQALTTKTYQLSGGSVTISFAPGVVNFKAAVPQSGYTTDVKDVGPDRVRVEFNKDGSHSKFQAEWVSGKLAVTVEE